MRKRTSFLYKLLIISSLCLSLFGTGRLYYHLTDDFRVGNVTCDFVYREDWDTGEPLGLERSKLEGILSQDFTYLGKGAQAYAFASSDSRYVLKFFKFKHLKPSPIIGILPAISPFNEYKQLDQIRKHRKFYNVFTGYKVANDYHKEESGIVYAHLNQTLGMWPEISVKDKMGFARRIDLDRVVFVIQDRAEKTRDVLNGYLKSGDVESAKGRIRQILDLYLSEYEKGVYDRDHGVLHNTGFVGNKVIHLDVGKFCKDPEILDREKHKQDLLKVSFKFAEWLENNFPMHYREIVDDIGKKLSDTFGEKLQVPNSL